MDRRKFIFSAAVSGAAAILAKEASASEISVSVKTEKIEQGKEKGLYVTKAS